MVFMNAIQKLLVKSEQNLICIVFILCSVSFIACVVLCTVFWCGVLFRVMCVISVLCLIVVSLPPGKNPFAV
jgi:hypothetical protein